jgi:hypothetical protein
MLKFHRKSNKVFDELVARSLNSAIDFVDDALESNDYSALELIFGGDIANDIVGAESLRDELQDLQKKHNNSDKIFRPTTHEYNLLSDSMKDYCLTTINDYLHP